MEKLNFVEVVQTLKNRQITIFSPLDFQRIFKVSFYSTKNFLSYHTKKGIFLKIKNGLYALKEALPHKFVLANKIYQPSYISFESALSYYNILPDVIYPVISATPKTSRVFETLDTQYLYRRMKKELFFGYKVEKIEDMSFWIAEPEKALIDYLYFVDLKKVSLNERLDISKISYKKAISILKVFKRKRLTKLLERLYDK